jgi:single-stranded-DNA-specific exonuclease
LYRQEKKKWIVARPDPDVVLALTRSLGCSKMLAVLLANRGITDASQASNFLYPNYEQLADPMKLPDADVAVRRIKKAIKQHELISIHGDYDVDGVTSAALMARLIIKLDKDARIHPKAHIPHRINDGYDIRSRYIEQAHKEGVKLIITTDCGIQRFEEVAAAKKAGMDVIITDHHVPSDKLPPALAVVNPMRADSLYPFKQLAGVGVAYRLGEALTRFMGKSVDSYRRAYADLTAIGTVTDIMPLMGENRVFLRYGLEQLKETRKPGLRALIESARLSRFTLTSHNIGFHLGPRMNAVGRMDDARIAYDLLMTRDEKEAVFLAEELENANERRKEEADRILDEARAQVSCMEQETNHCLVLWGESWHPGVVGLVANKIVDLYHRPAIVISIDRTTRIARGSARSIQSFNIYHALEECSDSLLEFGGHSHAAGLSLPADELEHFARTINQIAAVQISAEDCIPSIHVDMEIPPETFTIEKMKEVALIEPCGSCNETPLFVSRRVEILKAIGIGKDMLHLKLLLKTPRDTPVEAIMWGAGHLVSTMEELRFADICYKPEINTYNNITSVRFILEDIQPSG